jgi:hypothetical protein
LSNSKVFVKLYEGGVFEFFFLDGQVELPDTFKGKLFFLYKDFSSSFTHELTGKFKDSLGECCTEETDLNVSWDTLQDFLYVINKSTV